LDQAVGAALGFGPGVAGGVELVGFGVHGGHHGGGALGGQGCAEVGHGVVLGLDPYVAVLRGPGCLLLC
jgi:hypothetical protein